MKYVLFLVLIVGLYVPSFVMAEELAVSEEFVASEETLGWKYYNGENSNWIILDDVSRKKAINIKYLDKAGQRVESLSLREMDKVLIKENSREEVVSIQLYDASVVAEKDLELQGKVVKSELEEAKNTTEGKPLYKENGVWKN